jgi:hypothetical protein
MGLRIHYDLQLPREVSDRLARAILGHLRTFASTLVVESISPVYRRSLGELLRRPPADVDELEANFERVAAANLYEVDVALEKVEDRGKRAASGFVVHPGRGCAAAAFGLMRPGLTAPPAHFDKDLPWNCWWWRASCETQYASIISVEHLIDCHLAVVHVLDEADRLGVAVHVRDETGYWETRSVQQLLEAVDRANGIMARLI